jgi:hypothetical protein
MADIIITKKNEVYVKITCEKHIAQELSQFFTFFVPGHQFVPAFRNRVWDGKIRLFNLQTSQLYFGLLDYVKSFCEERGYSLENTQDVEDEYSVYHAKKFIDSLNIHSRGEPIEVRPHQIDAYIHAMQKRRALLLSPTASGKSLIIYLIHRQLLDYQSLKGLIVVPTTSLCMQMKSDFEDYSSHDVYDVEDNVSIIMQGYTKYPTKKIIKITLLDGTIKKYKEHDVVKTQRGNILAKDVISSDDIL